MAKVSAPPAKFTGFSKTAPAFWHELAIEMNRDWFEANKQRYETEWVQPMSALMHAARAGLQRQYGALKLGPPKILRIYRDVRFAKDKTPYKTHIAARIPVREGLSALYVHIELDEEYLGCGSYFFEPSKLARWRKLVAADATGKPLAATVAKLRAAGYGAGGHDNYVKVPKPYPADHPRAELLKMRGITASLPAIPRGMLHSPKLVDWIVQRNAALVPFVTWLAKHMK
jgi:uncharacterized protein (TIGR02453 family)